MKYTKQQKELIKELLDNSPNYIEEPLFGEDEPYYNLKKARRYLEQYRNAKLSLKQSDALVQLYQQDISKIGDEELQSLLIQYQEIEKETQREYLKVQQQVIATINQLDNAKYKLLLTSYYLLNIPIANIATEWKVAGSTQKGCTLRFIQIVLSKALKDICKLLQEKENPII